MPKKQTTYPWGSDKPSNRLRKVTSRLQHKLETAKQPGHNNIIVNINEAVQECRNLVDDMDFLSKRGLIQRGRSEAPLPHQKVTESLQAVRQSLIHLVSSSAINLSENYCNFETNTENLISLTADAMTVGIAAAGDTSADNIWNHFQT